jgi:hypothetical protein
MFLILLLVAAAHAEECLMACQRDYKPVCGTDGMTYSNNCQLKSFNCMKKTAVTVAYQGACVDLKESECNVACTMQNQPVCGTNGLTYGNLCQLESDACLKKIPVVVAHQGECADTTCNVACTMKNEPVCGTDGLTYGNLCQLESEACLKKSSVTVAHQGECVDLKQSTCNVACTMQNVPVCATNGLTYGNLCQLEADACLTKTAIAVAHQGECVDRTCNVACQMKNEPVCGTDGLTYGNLCMLESEACLKKSSVTVAHQGECVDLKQSTCNVACTMQNVPVCATNGLTYGNLCQLEADACLTKAAIAVAHQGECVEPTSCNVACTMQNVPVCGTNGLTYGNLCQLESDACLKKSGVSVARMGEC